jgi:hypothetical protein
MADTRKIAAILVADVVGYSRLAGADEEGTLARLRALRSELVIKSRSAAFSDEGSPFRQAMSRSASMAGGVRRRVVTFLKTRLSA